MHRLPRAFTHRQQYLTRPTIRSPVLQHRSQSRLAWQQNGGQRRVQSVRFVSRGLTMRQIATYAIYGGCIYAYYNLVVNHRAIDGLLDEFVEVVEVEEVEDVRDDGYARSDSLFIPLTWAKKLPRTFYRGSDPEWKEFMKIAKDKERHTRIQNELVQLVYRESVKHPGVARQLGNNANVGKYWLDISFPDGPPQEYERSGIEIADNYIAWSLQKIGPEDHWRLSRVLWPKPTADALWAAGKMFAGINYRKLKQALGWEGKDPFSPEERIKYAVEMSHKQRHPNTSRKQVGQGQLEPNAGPEAASGGSDVQPVKSTGDESKKLRSWMLDVPTPNHIADPMDIAIAVSVFQGTLAKQWNPKTVEPPRGTFIVQGLMEVRGQGGKMMFDVQSCYDPKAAKFTTINANMRSFNPWKQPPLGGP